MSAKEKNEITIEKNKQNKTQNIQKKKCVCICYKYSRLRCHCLEPQANSHFTQQMHDNVKLTKDIDQKPISDETLPLCLLTKFWKMYT